MNGHREGRRLVALSPEGAPKSWSRRQPALPHSWVPLTRHRATRTSPLRLAPSGAVVALRRAHPVAHSRSCDRDVLANVATSPFHT
jgi:hypothetical protein